MSSSDLIGMARSAFGRAATVAASAAPLLARLVYGQAFAQTGFGKLANFDRTVAFFTNLGIPGPAINAGFVGAVELVGGICLLLGLGARLAAFMLMGTMFVAIATAHRGEFFEALLWRGEDNLSGVLPVPFLVALMWILGHGAGPFALDRVLGRSAATKATPARAS